MIPEMAHILYIHPFDWIESRFSSNCQIISLGEN